MLYSKLRSTTDCQVHILLCILLFFILIIFLIIRLCFRPVPIFPWDNNTLKRYILLTEGE